jgi:hypothetical protein
VDLEDVIDPAHFPENELRLWQIHLDALVKHVEQPYGGEIILLRTRGQQMFCSLEEDFCWRKVVGGGVKVHRIPGSHENIFMEPNVQFLARELSACQAAARSRGNGSAPGSAGLRAGDLEIESPLLPRYNSLSPSEEERAGVRGPLDSKPANGK